MLDGNLESIPRMLGQLFTDLRNLYIQIKNVYKLWKQFSKIHDLFITGIQINKNNQNSNQDSNQDTNHNNTILDRFQEIVPELETFKTMVFDCGSIYIKFLQWYISKLKSNISMNIYSDETLFQIEFINYFQDIFENCPFHSIEHTREIFHDSMPGVALEDYIDITTFREIASGSIGQVYYARRKSDGREIAIKVKHPDITQDLETQMELIRFIRYCQSFRYIRRRYNMIFQIDDFINDINLQCNFNNEANNCKRFRENFHASQNMIIFPDILYQSEDLLISEYIVGYDFNDLTPIQKQETTINFVCFFYQMLFIDNFIHGDLHCKNWKVRLNSSGKPQLVIYDCGICFSNYDSAMTREFWFAIGKYDSNKMCSAIKDYLVNYNPHATGINLEEEIHKLFNTILHDSFSTSMIMKSILHFFNAHNIMVDKFLLNFSILMCVVEEFLKNNDVINRERNIRDIPTNGKSNMFEIINDNELDILAFCNVKNCYKEVAAMIQREMDNKYAIYRANLDNTRNLDNLGMDNDFSNTDDSRNRLLNEPSLFHSIKLSGLVMKPPSGISDD